MEKTVKQIEAERDALIEKYLKKLTKTQREVYKLMRDDGCFIVYTRDEHYVCQWVVARPDLTVVKQVRQTTVSALEGLHVHKTELGKWSERGCIYVAHEYDRHAFILRSYDASMKKMSQKEEAG